MEFHYKHLQTAGWIPVPEPDSQTILFGAILLQIQAG